MMYLENSESAEKQNLTNSRQEKCENTDKFILCFSDKVSKYIRTKILFPE